MNNATASPELLSEIAKVQAKLEALADNTLYLTSSVLIVGSLVDMFLSAKKYNTLSRYVKSPGGFISIVAMIAGAGLAVYKVSQPKSPAVLEIMTELERLQIEKQKAIETRAQEILKAYKNNSSYENANEVANQEAIQRLIPNLQQKSERLNRSLEHLSTVYSKEIERTTTVHEQNNLTVRDQNGVIIDQSVESSQSIQMIPASVNKNK